MREPIRPYVLNDRGEEKESVEFMKRCELMKKLDRPILYLDFETYAQGQKHDSPTGAIKPRSIVICYPPLL